MSVLRQSNFLGEQRIDVPHLRALESSIAADFDCLAGRIITGLRPMVVRGFGIIGGSAGALAKDLRLNSQDGAILHSTASEAGTIYHTPADRTTESLDAARNARVSGAFVPGLNYVGLDLIRSPDSSTVDVVQFFDTDSEEDVPRLMPLARTLDYKIIISTIDFSLLTNVLPIALIDVGSNGTISMVQDARDMLFRLGTGSNQYYSHAWLSRAVPYTSSFSGADKDLVSFKDWMNAVMSRLWELGGGSAWYSPASEKDVKLIRSGTTTFTNGEYFDWVLGTEKVYWRGLRFVFANGENNSHYNDILDNLGGITLLDQQCVYVDLDRTADRTGATAIGHGVAYLRFLSTAPDRYVIAWRSGTQVYTREAQYAVGTLYGPVATQFSNGMVTVSATPMNHGWPDNLTPMVPIINDVGEVIAYGLSRGTEPAGNIEVGTNANDNTLFLGRSGQNVSFRGTPVFAGALTKYKVVSAAETQLDYFREDAVFVPGGPIGCVWYSNGSTGTDFVLGFQLHVPAGATITAARVLASNTDATSKNVDLTLLKIDNSVGSPYTPTIIFNGASGTGRFSVPSGTATPVWSTDAAVVGTPGAIGEDTFVMGTVTVPSVTAGQMIAFGGIKFTYTLPAPNADV